jgi:hypothetical protein
VLDEVFSAAIEQYGWSYLYPATVLTAGSDYITGIGMGAGGLGSDQGVYVAQVVPEPGTIGLASLGLGLAALLAARRRRI